MNILQVSIFDENGGAEKVALDLHRRYLELGHRSLLVVGTKRGQSPKVVGLQPNRGTAAWLGYKVIHRLEYETGIQGAGYWRFGQWWRAHGRDWDVVHVHNLHSGYFDLSVLPTIARQAPIVQTLHDCWQFTGHCAHPFTCERWQTGCGNCPDLATYPPVRSDQTILNWRRKQRIYHGARPTLVVPSNWLRELLSRSFLGSLRCELIYNGVNTERFSPGLQSQARSELGLPSDKKLLLFVANLGLKSTEYRDPDLIIHALRHLVFGEMRGDVMLVVVGGRSALPEDITRYVIQYDTVIDDIELFYRAADIFVYPSKADNCPLVVLEAMACGLPVVATNVGGIPELVADEKMGFVVDRHDSRGFANAISLLLKSDTTELRQTVVQRAREQFSLQDMVDRYLQLYKEILGGSCR